MKKLNGDNAVLLARIEERLTNFKDDVKEEVSEIKKLFSNVFTKLNNNSKQITTNTTNIKNHTTNQDITRSWKQWIPSVIAILIAAIAVFK